MDVPVVIVGAGPSGLAMGLSLAKYKVKVSTYDHHAARFDAH